MAKAGCEFNNDCRQMMEDLREDVRVIRKAVLGNGATGIKDRVAMHGLAIKIIGVVSLAALGGAITAVVRLLT